MLNNFKNIFIGVLSAVIVIAIGASAYNAFAANGTIEDPQPANIALDGYGNCNGDGTGVITIPASDLNADETASLLYMREEEKLARDVYNTLFTVWGQPTFQNIAASEQAHMDEIKLLLDRYGLTDPALGPGQFSDANLQALYDQLVAQGSVSLADALKVGAAIEEIDILDLQARLALTDNADIQMVFNNLMNGSYSHLNSFTSVLTQQTGEIYTPKYLTAEAYQAIITGTSGNGYQGGSGTTNGHGNSGANGQAGQTAQGQTGSGVPQANTSGAVTVHGVISSFDTMGMSFTADDGQVIYVDLGNPNYNQSIGFAPQIGDGVTVVMFFGDQGVNSAVTVTMDATGVTYTFRSELGQPLWSGGNGKGHGNGGGNH